MKRALEPDASIETRASPSRQTLRGLDWLNFLFADVQSGVGPFLFLASVALAAFAILYLFMPETRNIRLEDA
jgi:hypothetical protein